MGCAWRKEKQGRGDRASSAHSHVAKLCRKLFNTVPSLQAGAGGEL